MGFSKTEAILLLLRLCFRWNAGKGTTPEQCYCRETEEGINGRTVSQASYNVQISKNTIRQVYRIFSKKNREPCWKRVKAALMSTRMAPTLFPIFPLQGKKCRGNAEFQQMANSFSDILTNKGNAMHIRIYLNRNFPNI